MIIWGKKNTEDYIESKKHKCGPDHTWSIPSDVLSKIEKKFLKRNFNLQKF